MADGFIVRKGGVAAEQTATPSILDFSTASPTSIKFKLRNNDSVAATLVYRFGTLTGDGESISVAANTTTAEITFTVPLFSVATTLFVTANATGKVKSEVAEQEFPEPILHTAATGGTTEEYDLEGKRYKSHTFTSNGTFEVTTAGNGDRNQVDYLIIAGGASGGTSEFGNITGGGGGAGGFRTTISPVPSNQPPNSKVTVTTTTYGITIGAGGSAITSDFVNGNSGSNSSVFGRTSNGGGGGGRNNANGISGGSGGGGGGRGPSNTSGGGSILGQGRNGGSVTGFQAGGGGGGAGGVGGTGGVVQGVGGSGGNGLANLLRTGSNETRALGGRAIGSNEGVSAILDGPTNTGNGGTSGKAGVRSGAGGSGIVVIRYEIASSV